MTENNAQNEIVNLLMDELARERKSVRTTYIVSALLVLFVIGYTSWLSAQISMMLDPNGLALTASGLVVDHIPAAGESLRETLVDGAPNIARTVSDEIIGTLPSFRLYLEEQTGPVVDQVAQEMTEAAIANLSDNIANSHIEKQAPAELAKALIEEFEKTITYALDEPNADGETPRERIDAALASLEKIDRELKLLERGADLPPDRSLERDLLMGWLEIIVHMNTGAANDYITD